MHRAPTRFPHALVACLLALLPLAVPARAASPWPTDPGTYGLEITNQLSSTPVTCSDGAGGVFVAYYASYAARLYVQHVSAAGALLWGSNGVEVGGDTSTKPECVVIDVNGGCYVSWTVTSGGTRDVWVQHLSAAGSSLFPAGGVATCTAANNQTGSVLCLDTWGNLYVAWRDDRSGSGASDIYLQEFAYGSTGTVKFTANGLPVCTSAGAQSSLGMVAGYGRDVFLGWQDERTSPKAIYAQHVYYDGFLSGPANGTAVTSGISADEWAPVMVGDGRSGAIVAWYDWRNGNADVFAQRLSENLAPLWSTNGVALTTAATDQTALAIAADGTGGAIVAWQDPRNGNTDLYAQRVTAQGTTAWTASGVAVCTAASTQAGQVVASDGSGGGIMAWLDHRSLSDDDVFAQHITSTGSVHWATDGVAVCNQGSDQFSVGVVPDGANGAIVTYGYGAIVAGGRIDRFGILGGAAPGIVSIADVPNDQGGYVSIRWDKCRLDVMPSDPVSAYWIWRQVPQAPGLAALRGGARLLAAGETPREGALRAIAQGVATYYWEYLGSVTAQGQAGYSVVEPTRGDSVAGSNPLTLFMVEARWSAVTGEYWDSDPLGGYSVDDLAPVAPTPFTGAYAKGATVMSWGANGEGDLAGYRLYRGANASFTPGPANLVANVGATSYTDVAGRPAFYKLTAVDVHGNEGPATTLQPAGTTDVATEAHFALALAAPAPNPAGARSALAFTLPVAGTARLALFDAAGRSVCELARGEYAAGEHHLVAELRDVTGAPLPPGLYLLRLEAAGRTLARRLLHVN